MTEVIESIDAYTLETFSALKTKLWGFCELSYKSAKDSKGTIVGSSGSQPIVMTAPVTQSNGERRQVALDDQYEFITWVRWVDPVRYEFNDEWSFGREEAETGTITLRIVVAHKAILGEDLIFQFAKGLPKKPTITDFQFVLMDGRPSINPDHESIYQTELGNTAYERHRFTWNIYAVDVTYNFLECEV